MHWISVAEDEVTEQSIPSIVTVTSAALVVKPVPWKEIVSPPVTVPYLGVIRVSFELRDPS